MSSLYDYILCVYDYCLSEKLVVYNYKIYIE